MEYIKEIFVLTDGLIRDHNLLEISSCS